MLEPAEEIGLLDRPMALSMVVKKTEDAQPLGRPAVAAGGGGDGGEGEGVLSLIGKDMTERRSCRKVLFLFRRFPSFTAPTQTSASNCSPPPSANEQGAFCLDSAGALSTCS